MGRLWQTPSRQAHLLSQDSQPAGGDEGGMEVSFTVAGTGAEPSTGWICLDGRVF